MKLHVCMILLLILAISGTAVSAQTTSSSSTETSYTQVIVSQVTINPAVMMVGDTGTITVTLTNTGTETVPINRATLFTDGINLLNTGAYDQLVNLGPDNSINFVFQVQATGAPGLYQPRFYVDYEGAGSMSSYIPLQIDNTGLQVSVSSVPAYFATGRDDQVTLVVGNPRDDNLTGITITPSGDGVRTLQSSDFVGDLGPGETSQVVFDVIPSVETGTNLTFQTTYKNGVNVHETDTVLPILIDNSRRSADLVVNDVQLTSTGGSSELNGDITNGGVDDAQAVIVSVQSPATPVDPYPSYVVGDLAVGDFSSFSITFTAQGLTSVPVLVQWKDSDGNSYENTVDVNLRTAALGSGTGTAGTRVVTGGGGGGGPLGGLFGGGRGLQIPIVPIIIIIVIAVVLIVAWRKGAFDRILKKGKGKQGNQGNQQPRR